MIAAQLLAYFFTELKDDKAKKVSLFLNYSSNLTVQWMLRGEHSHVSVLPLHVGTALKCTSQAGNTDFYFGF